MAVISRGGASRTHRIAIAVASLASALNIARSRPLARLSHMCDICLPAWLVRVLVLVVVLVLVCWCWCWCWWLVAEQVQRVGRQIWRVSRPVIEMPLIRGVGEGLRCLRQPGVEVRGGLRHDGQSTA